MTTIRKIEESLDVLSDGLVLLKDPCYIIGSAALVLAGVPLASTDDIDLLTSSRDAVFLKTHWKSYQLQHYAPRDSDKFRSEFGRFRVGEVLAEVMGCLEVYDNGKWQKLEIHEYYDLNIGGLTLRIPTLLEQERVFRLFGRVKDLVKADLIFKYIIQPNNGN